MPKLSNRVDTFTDSVIRRMTRICNQYGAINLSQGFPEFDPPREITDALAEVAKKGPHQYAVTYGAQNFREALAEKQGKAIGRSIDPNTEIVVTCGGTEAMMGQSRFTSHWFRRLMSLIFLWWKRDFRMAQRQLSYVIPPIRVARYLRKKNC